MTWNQANKASRFVWASRCSPAAWAAATLTVAVVTFLVAPSIAAAQTEVVEYYHHDAVGSIRAVTNEAGQVIRRYDYMPFGELWQPTYPIPERRLFTGQERDHETGLDYFGARYYRPDLGRFTTVDPAMTLDENLVDPQRWNRYAYGRNNPLRYMDPDGKVPILVIAGLVWGAYEIGSSIYDVYTAVQAWRDSSASTTDRAIATLGAGASVLLPGGGYGTAARFSKEALDAAPDAFRAAHGLRSFTSRNARENLMRLTAGAVPGAQAHHVFPQWKELSIHFNGKLNVNDPRFLVWWESADHLKNAAAYNKEWLEFFRKNQNAGLADILREGQRLADKYGFEFIFEM